MPKLPSMSSRELVKLLQKGGATFVRQGSTDHAIFSRIVESRRYSAPVQMGPRPTYGLRLLKVLGKLSAAHSVLGAPKM